MTARGMRHVADGFLGEGMMIRMIAAAGILVSATALAAQAGTHFFFDPVPRWQEEPEMEAVCEAIRRDCPAMGRLTDIRTSMEFDQIYDVGGRLVGLRMTRSTGCRALDESTLLAQRRFITSFSREGEPDHNDDLGVELAPGIDPAGVRLVRTVDMSIGTGCG